jgi:CRISPR-associated protein Cas2
VTGNRARRTIVAYDIPDDRRRNAVAHILEGFGDRVQYSVFIVDATAAGLLRLQGELTGVLDLASDSVLLCDLGPVGGSSASLRWVGRDRVVTSRESFIV